MTQYRINKQKARETAINWQNETANASISYEGAAIAGAYFEKLGRRFGLLREFRENCII